MRVLNFTSNFKSPRWFQNYAASCLTYLLSFLNFAFPCSSLFRDCCCRVWLWIIQKQQLRATSGGAFTSLLSLYNHNQILQQASLAELSVDDSTGDDDDSVEFSAFFDFDENESRHAVGNVLNLHEIFYKLGVWESSVECTIYVCVLGRWRIFNWIFSSQSALAAQNRHKNGEREFFVGFEGQKN